MTDQTRVSRLCCAGLPCVDAPSTPDDAARHTVSIVDPRKTVSINDAYTQVRGRRTAVA